MVYKELVSDFLKENKTVIILYTILNLVLYPLNSIYVPKLYSTLIELVKSSKPSTLSNEYSIPNPKNLPPIPNLLLIILIVLIIVGGLFRLKYEFYCRIFPKYKMFVRKKIFSKNLEHKSNNYKEIKVGQEIARLEDIIFTSKEIFNYFLTNCLELTIVSIAMTVYLCYLNRTIGLLNISQFVLIFIIIYFYYDKINKYTLERVRIYYDMADNIDNSLSNVSNILINNQTNYEINKNDDKSKQYKDLSIKTSYIMNNMTTWIRFITIVAFIAIVYQAYRLTKLSNTSIFKMSSLTFITILIILMKFHNYIYGQTWSMVSTIDRMAQLKYSESYLKEILNNDKNSKNLNDTITHGKIEFKNLKYSYIIKPKDTQSTHPPSPSDSNHSTEEKVINVLNNFNLTIKSKEKIAFLGKSGSGKSTLMKLLVRLLNLNPPNSGEILIDNINIQDININYLRKNVNYINQNTMLFDEDVYYNIKYGNKMDEDLNSYPPEPSPEINQITNNNINDNEINTNSNEINTNSNEINTNQKIENILRKYDLLTIYDNLDTKLHTKAGPKGTNLSHGMQKVTIIMRGIMRNSKIIILDEPLAGLDSKTREKIIKLILNECNNRTIIIITHDKEILPYMDRVVDINDINDKILSPSNS